MHVIVPMYISLPSCVRMASARGRNDVEAKIMDAHRASRRIERLGCSMVEQYQNGIWLSTASLMMGISLGVLPPMLLTME